MPYHGEGRRGNCDRRSCGARSDVAIKCGKQGLLCRQARRGGACPRSPSRLSIPSAPETAQCRVPVRLPEGQATGRMRSLWKPDRGAIDLAIRGHGIFPRSRVVPRVSFERRISRSAGLLSAPNQSLHQTSTLRRSGRCDRKLESARGILR